MAEEKNDQEAEEQLDKMLNEIDVISDADKEIVRIDSEHFRFSNLDFKLIENHQDAFDLEMMENRYTDYLLKYDYIVGDISYEKLRLRGFYEDYRKGIPVDMKISNLEDYLVEYCSFGCQYFVFERVEKSEADPESYFKKKNRPNHTKRSNKRQNNRNNQSQSKQNNQNKRRKQRNKLQKSSSDQKGQNNFYVKKKETQQKNQKTKNSRSDNKQQAKNKENKEKVQFKIRKKKD